jgi:sigma-B regulation protein RsbU (phosphoserine phosphatase)
MSETVFHSRMPEAALPQAALEVIAPDGNKSLMPIDRSPFLIGRGADTGNHVQLSDRRISRQCAALVFDGRAFRLEDRGQKRGLFINGVKAPDSVTLRDGDSISFGLPDSYELIFRSDDASLPKLLNRMEHLTGTDIGGGLRNLNLLLEATAMLHSHMPLETILANMVDQAINLTDADRGLLLEPSEDGVTRVRVARQRGGVTLPSEGVEPSKTAIRASLEQKRGVVTEDVNLADQNLQAAHSVIAQRLRAVVVIPLFAMGERSDGAIESVQPGQLLGVLYMDSRKPAAFSKLERKILDTLAAEAAIVMENARLVVLERERERLEREIGIARDIQRALLPAEFHRYPYLEVTGSNQSCLEVGGDYYDIFNIGEKSIAFVLADVSGKGLGAALMTTMLQGALSASIFGQHPAETFAHINTFLCDHAQVERYATMFFGTLAADGRLEYINAGHPSPVLVRDGKVETPFPADCCPVGLIPDMKFSSAVVMLQPGDTLVLFSDGVSEMLDPEQNEYGVERLKLAVGGATAAPLGDLQDTILDSVRQFARGARQADDVTLLLLRYTGAAEGLRPAAD